MNHPSLYLDSKQPDVFDIKIPGITDKMLSKELRDLEVNQLIKRTVYDSVPVVVEYSMTPAGKTLEKLIGELQSWGEKHRKRITGITR